MKKILIFSTFLLLGVIASQIVPQFLGDNPRLYNELVTTVTMIGLSFIMIHVGYEFNINKKKVGSYGVDYLVAMFTAAVPWIVATLYMVYVIAESGAANNWDIWKEALLLGRFAAPTASGVLFAMLIAAGLSATWMYNKTRILVIFDDLDTVLLMIPLKILMIGMVWQLGVVLLVMMVFLWIAWQFLHKINIPVSWGWVLFYSIIITGVSEAVYYGTYILDDSVPIHLEVLLPAFVLGAVIKKTEKNEHVFEASDEKKVSDIISTIFMFFVGLSMPVISLGTQIELNELVIHVGILSILINIGKMAPAFFYKKEATLRERLAVSIAMCPRGEVGAGIILLSLDYGITGPAVSVAILTLVLNLLLTPAFLTVVLKLLGTEKPVTA